MNTYRTAPGNLQSRRGHVFELLRDSPQAVRHQTVAAMLAILLLLPVGCCRRGPASALHFSGAAPDRRLVRQVLLQFPAHFRRSIFATLHVSGHAFNVVGQWTVENSDHFPPTWTDLLPSGRFAKAVPLFRKWLPTRQFGPWERPMHRIPPMPVPVW